MPHVVYNTSVFFQLMLRPTFLAASEKRLTMCYLRLGEKGAVVSKQQLSDEFLDGFRACEETPKAEETAVCSETDVDSVWQVLFCLTEHDAEEDGEQCGGQDTSLLDIIGDEEAAQQRSIVLNLALLTFMELAEDGEKF